MHPGQQQLLLQEGSIFGRRQGLIQAHWQTFLRTRQYSRQSFVHESHTLNKLRKSFDRERQLIFNRRNPAIRW